MKNNQKPLLLEMDLFKELRQKSPLGINGFKGSSVVKLYEYMELHFRGCVQ